MRAAIAMLGLCLVPGCFFSPEINTHPQAQITLHAGGPIYIGDRVTLDAYRSRDPDKDPLTYVWRAFACDEASVCDLPLVDSASAELVLDITSKAPIDVRLEATDPQGAISRDSMLLMPGNRSPILTARTVTPTDDLGGYVVGRTVEILADVSDPDGDETTLDAEVFPPKGSSPGFAGFTEVERGRWRLVPDAPGTYLVEVRAADDDPTAPLEVMTTVPVSASADRDPCLGAAFPSPTVPEAPLVLVTADGARAIAITSVLDDLDPYPSDLGSQDVLLGRPHFRWFVGAGGEPPVELAGSDVAELILHPDAYGVGASLVVRVELADRRSAWPTCDAALEACGPPECRQRASWHVSVR